jgi:hypothetical protein
VKLLLLLAPITFSGFIDLAAVYNANRPANHENFIPGTGTSGKRANELMLNLAQVQWARAATEEDPVGFTLSLVAGDGTDVVHSADPDFRHIYQASLAYRLPSGVTLEAGVFPSHIGMEGFYSKDNWNYTRSWLGELSPYYQTGVKASYAFNDRWSGQLHVLNGWQVIHDNDDNQAIGTQIAYNHGPLSASFNTYADVDRKFGDLVVIYRVDPQLQLGTSVDVGRDRGAGVYARYALDDRHALALRVDGYSNPDVREATLTYELRPRDSLIVKLETRYDRSTARVFSDAERAQFLALGGVVVTF